MQLIECDNAARTQAQKAINSCSFNDKLDYSERRISLDKTSIPDALNVCA